MFFHRMIGKPMMGLRSPKNHNICKIQQWMLCFWQIKRLFSKKQHLVFLNQRLKIMGPSCAKFLETTTIAHVQCICVLCAHFLARSVFILIQATRQKKCPKRFFWDTMELFGLWCHHHNSHNSWTPLLDCHLSSSSTLASLISLLPG